MGEEITVHGGAYDHTSTPRKNGTRMKWKNTMTGYLHKYS